MFLPLRYPAPARLRTYPSNESTDLPYPGTHKELTSHFDFFNYAGLHRPVLLVALPKIHITDITVVPGIRDHEGILTYRVSSTGKEQLRVALFDTHDNVVAQASGHESNLSVRDAILWEPGNPYLYTFEARLVNADDTIDCYRLPVGIRTVEVRGRDFLLNGKPVYFKGFGRHEDLDVKGKGLDEAYLVKDFNLMDWMGANSFRTSHYPYSEELMNLADRRGYLVIDEVPAVGLNVWNKVEAVFSDNRINAASSANHKRVMKDLVERDKNHPCVVMWSVANEAATYEAQAESYFKDVIDFTRNCDPAQRPITIVESFEWNDTRVSKYADVVCVNRYYGWYTNPGQLHLMETQLRTELGNWLSAFEKPLIVTEYGADAISGMHCDPPLMFSEEFQITMLEIYHRVFDEFSSIIGEHIWNFADFQTKQGTNRVMGNKKGVFTRQRQPKSAAFSVRKRWIGEHAKWSQPKPAAES